LQRDAPLEEVAVRMVVSVRHRHDLTFPAMHG
jgi:hypothetical protein